MESFEKKKGAIKPLVLTSGIVATNPLVLKSGIGVASFEKCITWNWGLQTH